MPTYSYRCDSCGNEFDLRQSFSAEPSHECPVCSNIARRRINLPAVIYKGSGFYTTDYARKSGGASNGSSKSSTSDSSSESSEGSSSASSSTPDASPSSTSSESAKPSSD